MFRRGPWGCDESPVAAWRRHRTGSSLFGQICRFRRFIRPPDTPLPRAPAQLRTQAVGSKPEARLLVSGETKKWLSILMTLLSHSILWFQLICSDGSSVNKPLLRRRCCFPDKFQNPKSLLGFSKKDIPSFNVSNCHGLGSRTWLLFLFFFLMYFIYLFLAALGLHCCRRVFSSCSERGLLFIAVRAGFHCSAFPCCRAWALGCTGFSSCGMWAQ